MAQLKRDHPELALTAIDEVCQGWGGIGYIGAATPCLGFKHVVLRQ